MDHFLNMTQETTPQWVLDHEYQTDEGDSAYVYVNTTTGETRLEIY